MVSSAAPIPIDEATIIRILQASKAEAAAGRLPESDQLLANVAQRAPNHPAVLNELGVRMMLRGAADQAQQLFSRSAAANPSQPAIWANLASSLKALGRRSEEIDAIEKALTLEPRHLSALLQKGAYHEEMGDPRNAARVYQSALDSLPPGTDIPPNLQGAFAEARAKVDADRSGLAQALEQPLAEARARHGGEAQARVSACLEHLMGQRRAFHSQPTWMYFPQLPAIEFFDRSMFPWLADLEAAAPEIRAELLRVLVADREGLQPYIDFPVGLPLDQFRELNRSRKWSAYFLWNQSQPLPGHIARCPTTARALEESVPRCRVAGRAPTAFFSILDPDTRIPAHTGITNTRLTVHLPLVVPPGCGFRVGATTREWVEGQAWVFDDTIEHEAWNSSDTPRAILIFDIWNPLLTAAEQEMIQIATEVYGRYYAPPAASGS
ncbi:MAG TPA: aspartyl/asparaginyl beta-hydroxylase domain-containing protein [Steroidobacteraceae bacterium]|jgi:aspartyl/asparaginyl beta-hydroxylase (cupin superfamily)/Flp pilus assembly protein TadD|nr:aspartyl/asparaginyl beta-hydroxylase domain-containing protein [Steroidobacteraceae bacterium]